MRVARALALATLTLVVAACEKKKEAPPAAQPGTPTEKAATGGGGGAGGGDTIVIGHVASLTGSEATYGDSLDKGIRLAIDERNASGGVKGKKLVVKTLDDQGKPEEAAVAMTRLITDDKVPLVLGEFASSRSLAMAPIADQMKVPMISPGSTNPRVTKDGQKTRPFVFRVCFIDPFQGTVMAKFATENLKLKNVAILRDVGNDYSVGLADFFAAKLKELGGAVVTDQSFKSGDQDFKAQLTTIKNKNPQAIFVPGYYTDVALIARQARELGIKQPLLGGDGWDSAKLFEIAQGALDGSYFSNHYSSEDSSPIIQDFVKKYQSLHGAVPDAPAVLGYDAAKVAIAAIERAPDLSGEALAKAIAETKGFQGVTGTITLDEDHNAVKPAVVLGIEKNAAKFVTSIAP